MHYYIGTGYTHCRSGSDSGFHHKNSPRDPELFDSGDSTLSDLDESESGSGSGIDIDPNLPYPGIAPIALRYLSQTTRPRNWCLALISNPWFERISMMVILLNCVTLGMYQPCMDDKCETNRCKILQLFDDFIFAFFALEMTIKMIAMGVYGHGSYLADSWNRLDLFIVIAGAIEYGLHVDNLNLSAVRTIRVLRPLRAINRIPSMRILVMLLLDTLPMLGNVLLLCFFVFFIFGIVGVQLWQGILRQRCYMPTNLNYTYNYTLPDISRFYKLQQDQEYICSKRDHSGMHLCADFPPYINGTVACNLTIEQKLKPNFIYNDSLCINWNMYYTYCYEGGKNPFQGTISFDNIGLAWVSIFLVISLEGWTDIMYFVQDAHSFWDWIYFVLLIVIGSFFMINLCLVVIATQFSETKKREMERMRLERARFQSSSTLASSTNNSEPNSCYAEIVKYIAHLWRRNKRKILKKIRLYQIRNEQKCEQKNHIHLNRNDLKNIKGHHPNCPRNDKLSQSTLTKRINSKTSLNEQILLKENKNDEIELTIKKRPSLLRVPLPNTSSKQDLTINDSPTNNLLSPPNNNRRRSSVMFSDVIVLHCDDINDSPTPTPPSPPPPPLQSTSSSNNNIDKRNVCSSEKTTQAGDGNIWQISSIPNQQEILQTQEQIAKDCTNLIKTGETMTCQELLALGAINATLPPTGQMLFDTIFTRLTSKCLHDNDQQLNDNYNNNFNCCNDLWYYENEQEIMNHNNMEKHSNFYIILCLLLKGLIKLIKLFRKQIQIIVEHKYFQQGILLAILINTLSMGIEYHEQPEYLTHAVETSNIIFSAIFAIEMLMKIIAEGPFGYISNGFNVFDGIIVVLSGIELFQKFIGESHTDSGLSVLRTFRLLRILKLVRFMPNLRRQLFVMLRTMDNVAIFFSLLILFIFIFSILGMYLFGGKFCNFKDIDGQVKECTCEMIVTNDKRCECDRKHFNNILWATVTVFQILTQEDWNMVLSNGMAKTSHWAALYFVALMTFGNYVLFNLLVAILVEGFSSERNERREREQRELARRRMSCILEANLRNSLIDNAGGGGGGGGDSGSRSLSSSTGSYTQDSRNCWKSTEELQKFNQQQQQQQQRSSIGLLHCNCKEKFIEKDSCFIDSEPKCNIQKESLHKQPTFNNNKQIQNSPPIITHTAATPQDSPSTILDDFPEFHYNVTNTTTSNDNLVPSNIIDNMNFNGSSNDNKSIINLSKQESIIQQKISSTSLLKPPSFSPPLSSFTLRQFERNLINDEQQQSNKIVIHNEKIGTKTMTFSEKVSEIPTTTTKIHEEKNIKRKSSWKLSTKKTNPCQQQYKKNKNLILEKSEIVTIPLNNGRSSNHSQCNGNGISRHASLRNDSLLQSSIRILNDTQIQKDDNNKKQANNLIINYNNNNNNNINNNNRTTIETKSINNLNEKKNLGRIQIIEDEQVISIKDNKTNTVGIKRLLLMFEPTGCMKERDEYSLYIFPLNNRFRQFCNWFVNQKWFDNLILLFIAMNCITLAMERPNIPPYSNERFFLSICNYIFTFVFTLEMFVKVISSGMCYGKDAYFTSGWNIMDGSLVIISIVDLLMSLISESSPRIFGILRVFRLLRSLRPLRVINRAPGLKLVVQTLLSSLRPIGNIVLICCTFFIIFGILGVQLFKGSFHYCVGENLTNIKNRTDCEHNNYHWENQKYNFDDLGQALMSLFVLSSRDGWVNIMYDGLDAVGVDQQPITNYSEWRLLYFISFILLVGFFVLNMFVGVVVENFHRCREEQEKEERIRRAAKRALQLEKRRKKMNEPPYYINYTPWRLFIHNVVTSKYFDLAIAAVIGLNVVTMATESYKMPEILSYILKIFNYFFTAVFIIESSMKLIALGVYLYMKDKWNQLDVIIVLLSIIGIILEELKSNIIPINPTVLRVMRVMRIARVLKLLKMAKGIRALLDTVMQALPQVGNLGLLFFLLFFIFAALGVELFGRLDCKINPCQGLGEHAHFENFGMAFLTLFRVATGDNWNGIMKDTLRDENCNKSADCVTNCCVSKIIAPIFFVIFVLMAQFVLVNVVVAVLMKHLEESHKHLEDEQDMDNQLEREFQEKQEMEERRELCLALQMDQEYQRQHKPLTKVLSLPSNFTYNPPGTLYEPKPSYNIQSRRQTLHCHQPLSLLNKNNNNQNYDDIRNIDESISDIYDFNNKTNITTTSAIIEKNYRYNNQNYDDQNEQYLLKVPIASTSSSSSSTSSTILKRINEEMMNDRNLPILANVEMKSICDVNNKLLFSGGGGGGSTRNLFLKRQKSIETMAVLQQKRNDDEIEEETPFLSSSSSSTTTTSSVAAAAEASASSSLLLHTRTNLLQLPITNSENYSRKIKNEEISNEIILLPKHDSQESVQRIITERRKLDENLKEINRNDIFEIGNGGNNSSNSSLSCSEKDEEQHLIENDKQQMQNNDK